MKLNVGAGASEIPGYISVDRNNGQEAFPLAYQDCSADEIRASHILEHFKQNDVRLVLADWVRVLKPGGSLKIAVPNFAWITSAYQGNRSEPWASYLLGGQQDDNDFHRSIFDQRSLRSLMEISGLIDIKPWKSDFADCSSLPVSLNLQGTKPPEISAEAPKTVRRNVQAVISVPRIGWNATWGCIQMAMYKLRITLHKGEGAFWGHVLTELIENAIAGGADYVLTLDYDSIFTPEDVIRLIELMELYPEADAIVPVQVRRERQYSLFGILDENGNHVTQVERKIFDNDITPISTGHFGLTLLRATALQKMRDEKRVWFTETPGPQGNFGEGCVHPDIHFWRQARESGLKVFLANDVRIGHVQMMVSWPDEEFKPIHQGIDDWNKNGPPKEIKR